MLHDSALRVADLPQNTPTSFDLRPSAEELKNLASELGLLGLRKLRFTGQVRARGKRDWELQADLGATVVQPCVVTLEPVTTRIDTPVTRVFLADWQEPQEEEAEMSGDDETEALGPEIVPADVLTEALALALPLYPRKDGAELSESGFTEPGKQAMTDEEAKPFAGLAALRDELKKDR